MEDSGLPQGWQMVTLDEVCEVIQGQSPPGDTYNAIGKGTPFFQGKAEFGSVYPTVIKWCSSPTKIAEPDDILISIRAPVGPTNLCPVRACIGRGLAAIHPLGGVPSRYILYALRDSESDLASKGTGSTFAAISGAELRSHRIALASLPAQHRIVAEIEKELARLDAAVGALKRVQANLKRYRASVLKAACEGRLVPTEAELARAEGRDYEAGEQLLARILKERRAKWEADQLAKMHAAGKPPKDDKRKVRYPEPAAPDISALPDLPEGWVWTTVDQGIIRGPQNGLYKPAQAYGEGTPIVRIDDYQDGCHRSRDDLKRLGLTREEQAAYSLRPNDILINRVNSAPQLGKCLVVPDELCPAVFESNMMRLELSKCVYPQWLSCHIQAAEGRARLTARAKWAVNQASINQADVRVTAFPLPPVTEQERILAEVDRRLSLVLQVELVISAGVRRAERLRQAILKRAFEGKLVPQDPNDEPASALLERIRADRASGGGALRRFASGPRPPRQKRLGKPS